MGEVHCLCFNATSDLAVPNIKHVARAIALFSPNAASGYFNILSGLRKELVRRGIVVHVGLGYLNSPELAQFCDAFHPDVVIEIDRTRNLAEGLPNTARHVAWLQDWRSMTPESQGRSNASFGGSDLYLFCTRPEAIGIDRSSLADWGYLLLATDPEVFRPGEFEKQSDFSLMGYIPPKEHLAIAARPLRVDVNNAEPGATRFEVGTVGELVQALRCAGLTWNTYDVSLAHRFMERYIAWRLTGSGTHSIHMFSSFGRSFCINADPPMHFVIPDDVLYDIENQLMRALGRKAVADAILSVSKSVRLYGLAGWDTYPEFASYFRGPLDTENDVREMFLSTRVNLHNAMSQVHGRVLDCMATGSAILVNRIHLNSRDSPDSLRATMEPGKHYFEYDEDNLAEVCSEVLADDERRRKVARAGREIVLADHTWSRRVDQLLGYLNHI